LGDKPIRDISEYIKKVKKHKSEMVIYRGYSNASQMWPTIVRSFVNSKCYKEFWKRNGLGNGLGYSKVQDLRKYATWDKPTSIKLKKLFFKYEETLFGSL